MKPDIDALNDEHERPNDDLRKIIDWHTFRLFCSKKLEDTMSKIDKTWWELGLSQEDSKSRRSQLAIGLDEYFNSLSRQENKFMEDVYASLKETVRSNRLLSEELNYPIPQVDISMRPMELKVEVDKTYCALRKERDYRVETFSLLKVKILDASEILRCPVDFGVPIDDDLAVQPRSCLELMQNQLSSLEDEIAERESNYNLLKSSILDILLRLGISSYDEPYVKSLHPPRLILSNEVMDSIQTLQNDVCEKNTTLKKCCDSLWIDIEKWWNRLDVSTPERNFVYEKFKGKHGPDVINGLESLKRELIEVRLAKMEECIERNLDKFHNLSGKTFMTYNSSVYDIIGLKDAPRYVQPSEWAGKCNESYLAYLEDVVDKLLGYYEDNKTLFTMITRREELWDELCRFESTPLDRDRFRNRGGILLQEEKTRCRIYRELPRIQSDLLTQLSNWSNRYTMPGSVSNSDPHADLIFLWEDGVPYSERLISQWEGRKCKTLRFAKHDESISNISYSHNDLSKINLRSPKAQKSPIRASWKRLLPLKTPLGNRSKFNSPLGSDTMLNYSAKSDIDSKIKELPNVPSKKVLQFKSPMSTHFKVASPAAFNNSLKTSSKQNTPAKTDVNSKQLNLQSVRNIFKGTKKQEPL